MRECSGGEMGKNEAEVASNVTALATGDKAGGAVGEGRRLTDAPPSDAAAAAAAAALAC